MFQKPDLHRSQGGIKGFIARKLDFTTDAEYVANLVICSSKREQYSSLHGYTCIMAFSY